MAIFAEIDQSAWTIFAFHPTDLLAGNNEFRGKIIQVNPETACAFGAHDCDSHFSWALSIHFATLAKWADNLVFGHF